MPLVPHLLFSYQSRWAWVSHKSRIMATNVCECLRYASAAQAVEDIYVWATGGHESSAPQLTDTQLYVDI